MVRSTPSSAQVVSSKKPSGACQGGALSLADQPSRAMGVGRRPGLDRIRFCTSAPSPRPTRREMRAAPCPPPPVAPRRTRLQVAFLGALLRVILWSGVEWVVTMPSVAGDESVRPRCGGGERASCALGEGCVSTEERLGEQRKTLLRFVFLLQRNGTRVAVGNVKRAQLFESFLDGVARLTVAATGTVLFCVTDGCTRGKPASNGPCATPHMHSVGDTKPSIKS